MMFTKILKLNLSAFCLVGILMLPAYSEGENYGIQAAWDNPTANMTAGSIKPGYAQLTWSPGAVLPLKLRNGMITMVTLPNGEQIESAYTGDTSQFDIQEGAIGSRTFFISPKPSNQGNDTNLIVSGKSGNKYIFYLRAEPTNASEITYSQVDVILDGNATLPGGANVSTAGGNSGSVFKPKTAPTSVLGTDGEDYGWIKSMKSSVAKLM